MVRKRGRYENAGRLQSIFTVNFRETDEILTILNSFRGNEAMEGHIADLYIKMQAILIDYDFTNKQKSDVLEFAIETLDDKENDDEILLTSSRLIAKLSPGSPPLQHERKFSGAHVCRVTFKHLPQPGTPSARFRRLDMDGFEYILLNFEYILLNLPRAEVGVTAEKFRRIYSRFRRIYSNSGGYIQN